MKSPIRAAGVLVMTAEPPLRFLLMRHADRWDLPKGHCDGNETFDDAARRELWEETGLQIPDDHFDPRFFWDIHYQVKRGPKHVRYFLAFTPRTAKIEVSEHESYRWFNWSPPHHIQEQTIDPLLAAVAEHLLEHESAIALLQQAVMQTS